ncbi:WxL domain-containing protein [Listeria rustica]|uniref:WxL domain-containing protein n=1 Tax=Listeria rustica TaxID=2713503 RepID=A0A7W1T947_9LIST|nr:WxL domain-containing protein [Listeria rustica]MBA3927714.1 WxL domain-containing protein [Listeria rustica]
MNKLGKVFLAGVFVVGGTFTYAAPTFAATVGSTTSTGDVTFTVDNGPTTPTDPTDPTTPVTPTDPTTPTSGPLRIDYVSNIHFGNQKISGSDVVYKAKFDAVTLPNSTVKYVPSYVQVTDNRGSNAGWKLQVSNTQFASGSNMLTGAELKLVDGTLNSSNTSAMPTSSGDVTLSGDSVNQDVVNAPISKGMGTWTHAFGTTLGADTTSENSSVTLSVPGTTAKSPTATYATTLTWTLSDTPD